MHQGIGLQAFNELPASKASHALYECCNSVIMAADLAAGRPYAGHSALFRKADAVLFGLSEESVDEILEAYTRPALMVRLHEVTRPYVAKFGFDFVLYLGNAGSDLDSPSVLAAVDDRMHNDYETERKVLRNEIAKINRNRLERMLGPEGGYDNWI
ncbi:MAG: 2-oxo-4-hydroxy-4-carboxy-5-ureidoimidazoline decarboxylase [Mycobacterium sp.]